MHFLNTSFLSRPSVRGPAGWGDSSRRTLLARLAVFSSVMNLQELGIPVLFVALSALGAGCAGDAAEEALTDKEKGTLDRSLQSLVRGDTSAGEEALVGTTENGEGVYGVLIRVGDREAFREGTIPVNSWSGSLATARLTVDQIRRAAKMEAVESIRLSGREEPHE